MLERNLFKYARALASDKDYSEEEQMQFFVRLERACIDNPDLPPTFVANCLMALSISKLDELLPFMPRNAEI
ncbi:hypothetical protein B6A14_09250 [Polynucleobacter hirudinilacicola]|uniref:Uncharacterized protein n=1 Tax=Polynucleobacter hirudinilacicola TaxID=1743166 RepID=A0A210RY38_9BURK|nr:hypothetical protein [Polynucleobacter hirudinilacicola]OWF65933.1 hypothetical protein B6A14_09250 [Polynucleobacter hirudinilacicola]